MTSSVPSPRSLLRLIPANIFHEVATMDKDFARMTDFLVGMGVQQVPHTHKSYLAHLIAVFRTLEAQGYPEDVCRAGMFHSIYGTERFQGFTLPLEQARTPLEIQGNPSHQ